MMQTHFSLCSFRIHGSHLFESLLQIVQSVEQR